MFVFGNAATYWCRRLVCRFNAGYPFTTHLNLPLPFMPPISIVQSFWKFTLSTAVSLSCSRQDLKMIGQLRTKSWGRLGRDFGLKTSCVGIFYTATAPSICATAYQFIGGFTAEVHFQKWAWFEGLYNLSEAHHSYICCCFKYTGLMWLFDPLHTLHLNVWMWLLVYGYSRDL